MKQNTVVDLAGRDTIADPLTEMLRTGARELIEKAVEGELQELLEQHRERRTEDGRAGVVRNGYLPERELQTQELRLCATGTTCARAQVATLRERLLKLGAWFERSVRRVVLHLPDSAPWRSEWCRVARSLGVAPS